MLFLREFTANVTSVTGLELNVQDASEAADDSYNNERAASLNEKIATLGREVRNQTLISFPGSNDRQEF